MSNFTERDKLPLAPPSGAVWFSLLGAPAAWALQGLSGWLMIELACVGVPGLFGDMPLSTLRWTEIAISLAALAIGGSALGLGIHLYHHNGGKLTEMRGETRPEFMAVLGVLISTVFLLGIFWAAWPLVNLPLCEDMR